MKSTIVIDKVEHYQYIYKVEKVQLENAGRYQCKAVYGGSEAKTTVSAKKSTVVLGKNLLTFPYLWLLLNYWTSDSIFISTLNLSCILYSYSEKD